MNWTNLKTYLIVLLVGINIFFAASYIDSMNKNAHLDDAAVINTVEFLEKQGIFVAQNTVPSQIYNSNIIECPYDEDYYEKTAAAISGSEKESINILPDNSIRIITENGSLFTFDSGLGFSYSKIHSDSGETLLTLEFTPESDNIVSLSYNQQQAISDFLNPYHQGLKDLSYTIKSTAKKSNGNVVAVCYQHINNVPVNSHSATIELSENEVVSAFGTWLFSSNSDNYTYRLYDQLSILVKEAQALSSSENDTDKAGYTITSLEHVYSIYWSANRDKVYLIPSWKLSTNDGNQRIYNAINCELTS